MVSGEAEPVLLQEDQDSTHTQQNNSRRKKSDQQVGSEDRTGPEWSFRQSKSCNSVPNVSFFIKKPEFDSYTFVKNWLACSKHQRCSTNIH